MQGRNNQSLSLHVFHTNHAMNKKQRTGIVFAVSLDKLPDWAHFNRDDNWISDQSVLSSASVLPILDVTTPFTFKTIVVEQELHHKEHHILASKRDSCNCIVASTPEIIRNRAIGEVFWQIQMFLDAERKVEPFIEILGLSRTINEMENVLSCVERTSGYAEGH
ncbi:hypothetical protein GCK72_023317 [Caenorhabditis remanei]|uniref:Uncharacterized protein n=1 Tax=Caenorhabditis remanei TaxID=31234 RepID=A0A6A5FWT6_CAERE|nr:hypothetical protein GCK72_023317 [Caenorhabditis remanei]KAF1746859.1 hypothetical protein GCK72_023317 [Caenorhabditis remanei]